MHPHIRRAGLADALAAGRLLHRFNTEFNEPTPEPEALAERLEELMRTGETAILLAGPEPAGLVVLRFRPAIWSKRLECYLAELYVIPEERRRGLGRALMTAAIELARAQGADWMDLGTEETDTAARALYESLGFINRHGGADGPVSYFYGREL